MPEPLFNDLGNFDMNFIRNFVRDESGASAAEYALIIAIVGVGIGAAALALGANVTAAIGDSSDEVNACNNATAPGAVSDYTTVTC
jgi:pilus assembly protein Flp/PilA